MHGFCGEDLCWQGIGPRSRNDGMPVRNSVLARLEWEAQRIGGWKHVSMEYSERRRLQRWRARDNPCVFAPGLAVIGAIKECVGLSEKRV